MSSLAYCGQPKNGLDERTALEIRAVELVAHNSPRQNYVRLSIMMEALTLGDPRLGGGERCFPEWFTRFRAVGWWLGLGRAGNRS